VRHDGVLARIGICEDDESVRRVLTEAFKMHGHEVVIARNGHEAVRNLAVSAGLDVLVIDIGLPDADGREEQLTPTEFRLLAAIDSPVALETVRGIGFVIR
jgi:DNA-binding NarL/FixJ family response regulator